jgi:isocitrate dehydrogenase
LRKLKKVKIQLKEKFDIKDLKILKYFLGIKIAHSTKRLFIKDTLDLLKETGKLGSKPVNTPIDGRHKINTKDGKPLEDV